MQKKFNIKDILKRNPHISQKDVNSLDALTEELHKAGMHSRGYQLPSPHERQHAKSYEEDTDYRTINLSNYTSAISPNKGCWNCLIK
jgi:hypothetical protein